MFKKIIAFAIAMMVITTGAVNANALCGSEDDRPGIIGAEYADIIAEIDERVDVAYEICMGRAEGYWVVLIEGQNDYSDYIALGMYDHMPNAEEIEILWANRMLEDEMEVLIDQLGL